ncbi:MAG TPA: hypothetical protein VK601_30420 [Kofleriaceae bacterium]|nr:hypothetical protein [Kofleriaceae bacterium]
MFKLVVGILKGAIIGGALGYGAFALEDSTGFVSPWLTYGVIGAIVGLFVGRPIWSLLRDKNATAWVSILKSAFGFGIGCGLYALISRVLHPVLNIAISGQTINVFTWSVTLGGAIGAVYGGFVELDDAIGEDRKPAAEAAKLAARPAPAKPPTKGAPKR